MIIEERLNIWIEEISRKQDQDYLSLNSREKKWLRQQANANTKLGYIHRH